MQERLDLVADVSQVKNLTAPSCERAGGGSLIGSTLPKKMARSNVEAGHA